LTVSFLTLSATNASSISSSMIPFNLLVECKSSSTFEIFYVAFANELTGIFPLLIVLPAHCIGRLAYAAAFTYLQS
jgi:hypothetical protein